MTNVNFHEKIALTLSLLILNNYLLLILNFPQLIIKINFLIFLITILIFYFRNFLENPFLKLSFLFIIFISLGSTIGDSQYTAFAWDPRSLWFFHAKRIFYDESILSIADNYANWSHNEYPNLAPAFASSLAVLIGHWNEVFPKLSFSMMFLPPMILVYAFLKDTQYLIFLSIVFFTIGNYLFNGYVDGLVAMYFCISAFLMYLLIIANTDFYKKKVFFYIITFSFFVTLTLIKNEGIALLFILFGATFLIKLYKKELKRDISKLIILSFSFVPIILWKLFCYFNEIGSINIQIFSTDMFLYLLPRMGDLNNYKIISYYLLVNEKFLFTSIFFFISCWINWNREIFNFVVIVTLSYILVLSFTFLSSPLDFYFQVHTTATRVIKALSFLLAFFGLYNLRSYIVR